MDKQQYLTELEKNLKSLPKQDRDDAMIFYEEYVSEMAESNPEKLDSLDHPVQVAAQIKAEVAMRNTEEKDVKKKKGLSTVWTVLLAIFALPIGLPIAIAVAAVALSLIIVAISLVFALFAVALAIFASGIAAIISGIILIPSSFAVSVFYVGSGLFCLGLGYILSIGFYDLSKRIFIGIAKLINKMRLNIQSKNNKKNEVA